MNRSRRHRSHSRRRSSHCRAHGSSRCRWVPHRGLIRNKHIHDHILITRNNRGSHERCPRTRPFSSLSPRPSWQREEPKCEHRNICPRHRSLATLQEPNTSHEQTPARNGAKPPSLRPAPSASPRLFFASFAVQLVLVSSCGASAPQSGASRRGIWGRGFHSQRVRPQSLPSLPREYRG